MKIYNPPESPFLIRVNIKKQGEKTEHITLCKTTLKDSCEHVKKLIENLNLSPFQTGKVITIEFREAKGSENGKIVSLSFKGMTQKEVKELILNSIL